MAKLDIQDIERIAKEVEEQEVRFLKRILEKDAYWEAYMDSEHGDWGDRD